ncbi:ABC transporter permease [Phenylobacterium sp.]|uniref:ABC transporter permease n=1 Tax=Phenylobacterium sp. TaxID=1871053 RepID=UPI0035AEA105
MTPLALRFAARELRGGVRGFRIFLACLALGVAAIAAAGSTAEAFRRGLATEARDILGGDLAISTQGRAFSPAERQAFQAAGRTAYAVAHRAMAEAPSGERWLVELRGVSAEYPVAGRVTLAGAADIQAAVARQGDAYGAAVEQGLLDRLGLRLGDRFLVGNVPMVATAVLLEEPDRLSRGFALGPRVLTSLAAVEAGGGMRPGFPFGSTARIVLPPDADPARAEAALRARFPGEPFRVRTRDEAAQGFGRMIDQLEYFLAFIGLASLVAGGLGVYGAVNAYLQGRKPVIATLKSLGAEGRLVRDVYLAQIAVLALLGIGLGLAVGAAAPLVLGRLVADELPVPALFAVYPGPLAKAAAFGALCAAAFSLAPLARARQTPPASLFRSDLAGRLRFGPEVVGALAAAAGLAALAIVTAPTLATAAIMIAGVCAAFVLLWLMGAASARLAGRLRTGARGPLRIGLANLAGPGSAARTAAPAIGLGVALLAAVVLIQSSLLRQVSEIAPRSAPAIVFTEVPQARAQAFDAEVARAFGRRLTPEDYYRAPLLNGRITHVRGQPVDRDRIAPGARWAYDSSVTLSAIGPEPPNAMIRQGRWWPADYRGPPLLAMSEEVAAGAGLKLGDAVTVQLLGRDIEARIAVLREVEFGGFGASFPLVLTPNAIEGAEPQHVAIAKATRAQEAAVIRALGRDFPEVNVISVREQLEAATALFDRLALAVRGAAAVAALAGLLVLAGAIAARARERTREAATLKVLGASRGQILAAYVLEYGAVGLIAGTAGVALGYAAAWPVVVKVFETDWSVDWGGVLALLAGAAAITGAGGLLAAFQALSKRPAPALRAD